ncbi:MAG: hypothetical protein KA184_04275 [Candidatus Hydrogenedentes bacterium]|nr:hypothetical protein [Candidatus Hydrogenedentota bacterium]
MLMIRNLFLAFACLAAPAAAANAQEPEAQTPTAPDTAASMAVPSAEPCETCRIEDWGGALDEVRGQLNLLQLLAQATQFGGMTIKIPKEIQRIPLEQMEGTEELVRRDIRLYLKEVRIRDFRLDADDTPKWLEERPLVGALAEFGQLGVSLDAQTRVGTFPVKCDLKQGAMPVHFHCKEDGFDIGVAPPYRAQEARIEDVSLDLGGPVASGILTRVFGRKVASLVLEAAAGQTLQLDEQTLLGGVGAGSLLKDAPEMPEGIGGLVQDLLK